MSNAILINRKRNGVYQVLFLHAGYQATLVSVCPVTGILVLKFLVHQANISDEKLVPPRPRNMVCHWENQSRLKGCVLDPSSKITNLHLYVPRWYARKVQNETKHMHYHADSAMLSFNSIVPASCMSWQLEWLILLISSGFLILYGHFYTELCLYKKCVLPTLRLLFHTWTKNYDLGWPIFQKFRSGETKIFVRSYCMEKALLVGVAVRMCSQLL